MSKQAIIIHEEDNVANLVGVGQKGDSVTARSPDGSCAYTLEDNLPANHKFAIQPIKAGDDIIKYGCRIGRATQDIGAGMHVHAHNIESLRGRGDLET